MLDGSRTGSRREIVHESSDTSSASLIEGCHCHRRHRSRPTGRIRRSARRTTPPTLESIVSLTDLKHSTPEGVLAAAPSAPLAERLWCAVTRVRSSLLWGRASVRQKFSGIRRKNSDRVRIRKSSMTRAKNESLSNKSAEKGRWNEDSNSHTAHAARGGARGQ